jgi:CheY-like chemotaxis protein/HPt (histidine-containing phosphotransfer) domain-containing protein
LQGRNYDAVLLDWQLQEAGGAPLLKQIRGACASEDTPFILLTNAYGHRALLKDGAANQADAVLVKPITGSSLFDSLHEVLTRRKDGAGQMPVVTEASQKLLGRRLLLVEDNAFNQQVAKGMLEHNGAKVDVAEDGQQAVQMLRQHAQNYDLVLMDVQMPVMDGFAATSLIRTELRLDLPILAMTAGVMESERDKCLRSGMNGFIAKPIDVELMLSTILSYLPQLDGTKKTSNGFAKPATGGNSPHFDPRWFNALTKGNTKHRETVVGYLRKLIEKGDAPLQEIKTAWNAQQVDETAHLLHRMRGSIGTLGARRFAELTLEMERRIRDDDFAGAQAMLPQLETALSTTIDEASIWLEEHDASMLGQTTS